MKDKIVDIAKYNRLAWNRQVEKGNIWTRPVDKVQINNARKGNWSIVLTPLKAVPREWFPKSMEGKKVLCLASGGGQQGPILAAAGADVVVFDSSTSQLEQDEYVAQRDALALSTELGDMRDLSRFTEDSFDLIVHPASNAFIESVLPVWQEAYRVLKPGGVLLSGFANPIEYIFELRAWQEGKLAVKHSIPYSDANDLSERDLKELILDKDEPLCYGHSLQDQIQGQIESGFAIVGFYEDKSGDGPLDDYIDGFIATRAVKYNWDKAT
jgi:SAM-dependent methyltransferase